MYAGQQASKKAVNVAEVKFELPLRHMRGIIALKTISNVL